MRYWTTEEDEFLQANAGRLTAPDMAAALGRSVGSVTARVHERGLVRFPVTPASEWTEDEAAYLGAYYGRLTPGQIAAYLHRSRASVIGKANKLGLSAKRPRRGSSPAAPGERTAVPEYVRRFPIATPGPAPTCQWLDGRDMCGVASARGKSYCAEHAARVYVSAGGHAP